MRPLPEKLAIFAALLILGLGCGSSSPSAPSPPNTPVQLTPADRAVFNNFPRDTALTWSAVSGAASYWVEVEYCPSGPQCVDGNTSFLRRENVTGTSFSFVFVGAQPGRWRVWAVGPTGLESAKSPWRTFFYTI
jgi:eukaryotic-like serine/threonine-protein kinase